MDPSTFPGIFGKIDEIKIEKIKFNYLKKNQFNSIYNRHWAKIFSPLDRSRGPLLKTPTPS